MRESRRIWGISEKGSRKPFIYKGSRVPCPEILYPCEFQRGMPANALSTRSSGRLVSDKGSEVTCRATPLPSTPPRHNVQWLGACADCVANCRRRRRINDKRLTQLFEQYQPHFAGLYFLVTPHQFKVAIHRHGRATHGQANARK